MNAEALLRAGQLTEALRVLQQQVRSQPGDAKLRVFLFQLLCVLGEWDRASTQLDVAAELDAGTLMMVQSYREALRCEAQRVQVFTGQVAPTILGEPEAWLAPLVQSLMLQATGHYAEAAQLRTQAFEQAPAIAGVLDGTAFEWLADGDSRLGPCLEVIVNGQYYWVPFGRIREMRLEPPADLRDLVWSPVQLTWQNGGQAVGMIPTRYPDTEHCDVAELKLARRTEWRELPNDQYLGVGQRVLVSDQGECALLDIRLIELLAATTGSGNG